MLLLILSSLEAPLFLRITRRNVHENLTQNKAHYKMYNIAHNFALKTIFRNKWINQNYFVTLEYSK